MTAPASSPVESSPPGLDPSNGVAPAGLAGLFQAVAGGMLLGLAGRADSRVKLGLGALGAGLLAGALAPHAERMVLRAGSRRRAAEVETTFTVEQPVREVFGFFSDLERLLPLLPGIDSITDHQDGRTDWRVRLFRERVLEWRAIVTKYVPGQVIAWESVPGSAMQSSGVVRFSAPADGSTQVAVRVTFLARELELAEALQSLLSRRMQHRLQHGLAQMPRHLSEWARAREGNGVAAD